MTAKTRPVLTSVNEPTLYVAFELGKKEWKLAMTSGFGVAPWLRTVAGRRFAGRGARGGAGAAALWLAGAGAGGELLRGGARRLLAASRAGDAGDREPRGGLVEYRGESPRAARENGSARCAQAGADVGAGVSGGEAGVERSPRPAGRRRKRRGT